MIIVKLSIGGGGNYIQNMHHVKELITDKTLFVPNVNQICQLLSDGKHIAIRRTKLIESFFVKWLKGHLKPLKDDCT